MLNLEDIEKRLGEIPIQINKILDEKNQLLGYKQALLDADSKPDIKKEVKSK